MNNEYRFNGTTKGNNYHAIVCWSDNSYSWYVDVTIFSPEGEIVDGFNRHVLDHVRNADGSIAVDGPHRLKDPRKVAQAVIANPENF